MIRTERALLVVVMMGVRSGSRIVINVIVEVLTSGPDVVGPTLAVAIAVAEVRDVTCVAVMGEVGAGDFGSVGLVGMAVVV